MMTRMDVLYQASGAKAKGFKSNYSHPKAIRSLATVHRHEQRSVQVNLAKIQVVVHEKRPRRRIGKSTCEGGLTSGHAVDVLANPSGSATERIDREGHVPHQELEVGARAERIQGGLEP
jgi:hypothetical protein